MNSKDYFDQFYEKTKERSYSKSLYRFFNESVRSRIPDEYPKILDIGAGEFSIFEDVMNLNADITAIDFSSKAIAKTVKSKINYREVDITDPAFFKDSTYDLVFDSHCMNCILEQTDRDLAFKNIYRSLKEGGIFASELMVQPIGSLVSMPFKRIKTAMELEQEILSFGFRILYFLISKDSTFTYLDNGKEINCDVLKMIAQK